MTTISFRSEAFARGARMLRTALGPAIAGYLEDPSIVEVMLNPDGRLWIDRLSGGLEDTAAASRRPTPNASFASSRTMSASRFMPAARASRPSCRKAGSGSRAWCRRSWRRRASPSAGRPSRSSRSTTMSRPASCPAPQAELLRAAVRERKNILVAGGTSTGKTTLVNALLAEVAKTGDRVVLIEDTRELQCAAPNLVALRTKDGAASLSDLVRSSLRLRPDRIPIGEVRGAEALDLLKAWGTGHPGGVGTLHAGSAIGALRRLEQLIQEAVVTVPRALIAETIDLIAVLAGRGSARRLAELAVVEGLGPTGDYVLTPAGELMMPLTRVRRRIRHGLDLRLRRARHGAGLRRRLQHALGAAAQPNPGIRSRARSPRSSR